MEENKNKTNFLASIPPPKKIPIPLTAYFSTACAVLGTAEKYQGLDKPCSSLTGTRPPAGQPCTGGQRRAGSHARQPKYVTTRSLRSSSHSARGGGTVRVTNADMPSSHSCSSSTLRQRLPRRAHLHSFISKNHRVMSTVMSFDFVVRRVYKVL